MGGEIQRTVNNVKYYTESDELPSGVKLALSKDGELLEELLGQDKTSIAALFVKRDYDETSYELEIEGHKKPSADNSRHHHSCRRHVP